MQLAVPTCRAADTQSGRRMGAGSQVGYVREMQRDFGAAFTDRPHVPAWLARGLRAIETDERLDEVGDRLAPVADALASSPAGPVLRGEWLGHALHPLLTDLPLGCWLSAGLLDLFGGRASRRASQRLVGFGLLTVPVTAWSGLVDWSTIRDPRTRRVGVAHAVGNGVVAVCYFRSWRARRHGHHGTGRMWGFAGGALAWGTGYLGGHLSFGRGAGQGTRGLSNASDEKSDEKVAAGPDVLVDFDEAADMLGVDRGRVDVMVDDQLLMPVAGQTGEPRLRASEVRSVRLLGG